MQDNPTSLGDVLRRTCREHGARTAIQAHAGKEIVSLTYADMWKCVRGYAAALLSLGLKRGDRIAVFSENCREWVLTDWACQTLGISLVPIYPTLPSDQAEYIVKDSGAKLVLAGSAEHMKKVEWIEGAQKMMLREADSLDALASTEAGNLSEADWNARIDDIHIDDLATIIYTSGTTGPPKGAMISHRAFIHVCREAKILITLDENDVFLNFLPMSHILARIGDVMLPVYLGAAQGIAKSLVTLANDMAAIKPTIMLCVPRFLESMRDRAFDAAAKQGGIKEKLFQMAVSQGAKRAQGGFAPLAGILDKIVGNKIRERTGGRLRFYVSGGAALPTKVAEFFMAMGLNVLQGYGLTETTGGTCINHPQRNKYWTVGEPLGMEIKIAADGEILIKGPALMDGYLNRPEDTAEAIDKEGWFHTGDIGEMEGKSLKITDRKKDLLVLGNGKNIAPQPIENKLKTQPLISEAVVLGDGMEYCIALIVPNFEALRIKNGSKASDEELAADPNTKVEIKKEIDAVNKTLASFEIIKKHAIILHPFTIEGGELTPTLKVKRKVVKEKYADVIQSLR